MKLAIGEELRKRKNLQACDVATKCPLGFVKLAGTKVSDSSVRTKIYLTTTATRRVGWKELLKKKGQ